MISKLFEYQSVADKKPVVIYYLYDMVDKNGKRRCAISRDIVKKTNAFFVWDVELKVSKRLKYIIFLLFPFIVMKYHTRRKFLFLKKDFLTWLKKKRTEKDYEFVKCPNCGKNHMIKKQNEQKQKVQ